MATITLREKPIVGITIGDYNGIGPEVIIKCLNDVRIHRFCIPLIYGSAKAMLKYRKLLNIEDFNFQQVKSADQVNFKKINLINLGDENIDPIPGKMTNDAGTHAVLALKAATDDLKKGLIDAVVTAPINKFNTQSEAFNYPGHTEYFTEFFEAENSLMLLTSETLKVGVVTGHMPLSAVPANITKEKVIQKAQLLEKTLKNDFNILKPRIAILGLNPHAGEDGLLGHEEKDIIKPAIDELKRSGMLVYGPYPADGFFGNLQYKKFSAVLAMYHDQGLIPFKLIAFETGVNYTAGLSVVRTSPDHGTAYNIAGRNQADESSFREALYLACEIYKNKKEKSELIPMQ